MKLHIFATNCTTGIALLLSTTIFGITIGADPVTFYYFLNYFDFIRTLCLFVGHGHTPLFQLICSSQLHLGDLSGFIVFS